MLLVDHQNGSRHGQSYQDHFATLSALSDTCKQQHKSTFGAFVDFTKAVDRVDKHSYRMNFSLQVLQLASFLWALKSQYSNEECCIRMNGISMR